MYREEFGNKGIESLLGTNVNQMEEPRVKEDDERKEGAVSEKPWGRMGAFSIT